MESVTVVNILVKEGANVAAEQGLIEVETQKAMSEVAAPVAGFVRKLAVKDGDVIGEKALICYITSTADEPLACEAPSIPAAALDTPAKAAAPAAAEAAPAGAAIKAAPATRRLAKERNVDLAKVKPTGAGGMITVQDVESHAASHAPAPREGSPIDSATEWTAIPPARMAFNLQMQKSLAEIPQIVVTRCMDVTPLIRKEEGVTFTHKLIVKLGEALEVHPVLRTATDGKRTQVMPVGVAVAIDTPAGLIAPVLRAKDLVSVKAVASRLNELRDRADRRVIKNEELADGPFALTNLGAFGVDFFSPFVFHGQTAVLAVGKSTGADKGGQTAWFSLAVDHRIVDGAEAARFLETLQQKISP